jgi:GntR family transcriptional repressor for pyruvate dehydrogenase complex
VFKSVRHTNIAQQVIDQIRDAILKGRVKPGDKLPAEMELVQRFQVSKQTLREALRALEYLGLIEMRKGVNGGAYIAEVDMEVTLASLANFLYFKNVSIEHISAVRKAIEPHCARLAAERISEENLQRLNTSLKECEELSSPVYSPEVTRSEISFHRIIANSTENPIMILLVDFVENLLQDVKDIIRPDEAFRKMVLDSHKRIYQAIEAKDPQRAYDEMFKDVTQVGEFLFRMADAAQLAMIK